MTSIITRYLPATNHRPARIQADAGLKRRVTISFPHGSANPHRDAAIALCKKFDWHGTLVQGGTETGSTFVFLGKEETFDV